MAEPTIEVLGVYRLRVTEDMFREQFCTLYGRDPSPSKPGEEERNCRECMESAVLIELLVKNRDGRFDAGDFAQRPEGLAKSDWQVAWAEAFLSADGAELIVERLGETPPAGDLRIAFYLHFWDPDEPLWSSYGQVMCPEPIAMPERLERLVPYELLD